MRTIYEIAQEIVAREGGFVNDPDDPGGPTQYGITLDTLRRFGGDLTGDGRITVSDLRRITPARAAKIFVEHYFKRPRIGALPAALHPGVFDMYVNAGRNAVRILQRLLRKMKLPVAVDGVIGPETIGAARKAYLLAPNHLADCYAIERRNYYLRLADRRPASRKYVRTRSGKKGGWIRRAEALMSPRFHMSPEEFRERTSKWG